MANGLRNSMSSNGVPGSAPRAPTGLKNLLRRAVAADLGPLRRCAAHVTTVALRCSLLRWPTSARNCASR